jgi:hypothetical protein
MPRKSESQARPASTKQTKKVTFSDMVENSPRRFLSKSPSTHDLDQVPSVETAYVDLNMTSKTNFAQPNKTKVDSNNDTTAPQPYVSMQEQGERGHDESLNEAGSVIPLCTLGYTRTRKRLPMLKIQVSINGHGTVALVDCGCEASITSHPSADKVSSATRWGIKPNTGMAP